MTAGTLHGTTEPLPTHDADRPSWNCTDDHEAWPCAQAREQLQELFTSYELFGFMSQSFSLARADYQDTGRSADGLYQAFLGWVAAV